MLLFMQFFNNLQSFKYIIIQFASLQSPNIYQFI